MSVRAPDSRDLLWFILWAITCVLVILYACNQGKQ